MAILNDLVKIRCKKMITLKDNIKKCRIAA